MSMSPLLLLKNVSEESRRRFKFKFKSGLGLVVCYSWVNRNKQPSQARGFTVARQSEQVKKYEKSLVMDQCRLKGSSILAVLVDTPNLTSGIWEYLLRVAVG